MREVSDKLLNDWKESFSLFDMIKLPNVVKNNTEQSKIKTNKQKLWHLLILLAFLILRKSHKFHYYI